MAKVDTPVEVVARFPYADVLRDDWVVFNVKANHYRIVTKIDYPGKVAYIRFIGIHDAQDRIDADKCDIISG
ncbi:MAG: type II toxin-antitoxin system HigB family toxin [Pseudomonadota bacterium]